MKLLSIDFSFRFNFSGTVMVQLLGSGCDVILSETL